MALTKSQKEEKSPKVAFAARARDLQNDALKRRGLADLDEEEEMDEEEEAELENGEQEDIFDVAHERMEKGDIVSFYVYKDNQFIATKPYPYSWEKIQKDFGGGHYRLQLRSEKTKRYIKQQTQFVGQVGPDTQQKSTADLVEEVAARLSPPARDPMEEMTKMAALMKNISGGSEEKAQAAAAQSTSLIATLMQTMMQSQQQSSQMFQQMMLSMQDTNRQMLEKMNEANRQMIEKLESKIASPKEKALDPLALLTLVQTARKEGREDYLLMEELAEKRAEKLAEENSDKPPESAMGKLVNAVTPIIAAAAQKQSAQAPQRPMPPAPPRPQVQHRPPPKPVPSVAAVQDRGPATVDRKPDAVKEPQVLPKVEPAPVNKEKLLESLLPLLANKLIAADSGAENNFVDAAKETVDAIKPYTVKQLIQTISKEEMLELRKQSGLPERADQWLVNYYGELSKV